jgi:predicted  nucleic acid-binding Zn-ribbon protein
MIFSGATVQGIVLVIILVGGSWGYFRARKPSQDTSKRVTTLEGLVRDYEKKFKGLEDKLQASNTAHTLEVLRLNKEISALTGELKVWREQPLQTLTDAMNDVVSGNQAILGVLQKSAITLVKDTKDVAVHVAEVRQDLRSAE